VPLLEPPLVEVGRAKDQPIWDRWYWLVAMVSIIGLEWALRNRDRVLSLTVLDTLIDVAHFRRVWTMDLAAPPLIGPLWVATIRPPVARWLFYLQGIADRASTPAHEVDAHIALLHHDHGGSSFRKIVRGFELTEEKERFYTEGLREAGWPATILWADRDPALGEDRRRVFEDVLGVEAQVISPSTSSRRTGPRRSRTPSWSSQESG
jgi:hypothetical protein